VLIFFERCFRLPIWRGRITKQQPAQSDSKDGSQQLAGTVVALQYVNRTTTGAAASTKEKVSAAICHRQSAAKKHIVA
jgi:hypothetical protein